MHFLEDLLAPMGRSERQHWARIYVQGLLLDGERKSIEPLASRIAGAEVQALRQLVGQSPWAVAEVQRRLAHQVIDLLSEAEVWIIDETSLPKAGRHSVGVARQYCGTLGKIANCQVAVSLHWSSAEASCPLIWRLYLPHGVVGGPGAGRRGQTAAGDSLSQQDRVGAGGARPGLSLGTAALAGAGRCGLWQ
jgi:SRSO17 transposase